MRTVFVLLSLFAAVALSERAASTTDVQRGIDFLAPACSLDARATALVRGDTIQLLANKAMTARTYVLAMKAAYDEWITGLHYLTGAPHEMIDQTMAQCCLDHAGALAGVVYDAEFESAVRAVFDSWAGPSSPELLARRVRSVKK